MLQGVQGRGSIVRSTLQRNRGWRNDAICQAHMRCSVVSAHSGNAHRDGAVRGAAGTEQPTTARALLAFLAPLPTNVLLGPTFLLSNLPWKMSVRSHHPAVLSPGESGPGGENARRCTDGDPRQVGQGPVRMDQPSAEGRDGETQETSGRGSSHMATAPSTQCSQRPPGPPSSKGFHRYTPPPGLPFQGRRGQQVALTTQPAFFRFSPKTLGRNLAHLTRT